MDDHPPAQVGLMEEGEGTQTLWEPEWGRGEDGGVLPSLRPKQSVTKSSAGGSSRRGCNSAFVLPVWVAEPWPSNLPTLSPIILLAYLPGEGSGVLPEEPLVQDHRFCSTCQSTCGRWIFPEVLLPTLHPLIQD